MATFIILWNTTCEELCYNILVVFVNNRDAVRYCFGPLIENDLAILVTEWNHHRIRKTANAEAPGGIPEVLYYLPDSTGIILHGRYTWSVDCDPTLQECWTINIHHKMISWTMPKTYMVTVRFFWLTKHLRISLILCADISDSSIHRSRMRMHYTFTL